MLLIQFHLKHEVKVSCLTHSNDMMTMMMMMIMMLVMTVIWNITDNHSFGIKYSDLTPENYYWQLSLISIFRSFLTQYLTINVHYLHNIWCSWYCSIASTNGTIITVKTPLCLSEDVLWNQHISISHKIPNLALG